MSSILDALKKAQQESGEASRDQRDPLPLSPLPGDRTYRKPRSRHVWLLPLVLMVAAAALATIFWPLGKKPEEAPLTASRSQSAGSPAVVPKGPSPSQPAASQPQQQGALQPAPAPAPARVPPPESGPKASPPRAAQPPETVNPIRQRVKPVPDQAPTTVAPEKRMAVAAAPPLERTPAPLPARPVHKRQPVSAPAAQPTRQPPPQADSAVADPRPAVTQTPSPPPATEQPFRDDPRIDLQALVWAPEAAQRFVVVNNRLIREGGSVDNIVVVRIDRDEVLFSEGGDQWYQKFNIR